MQITKNIVVPGSSGRPMATDIFYKDGARGLPVVIYAHGFKGFKDWGNFDLIAQQFAGAGFTFIKFNFSHNGTTPENPEEFTDLEAFGHNNYTKELDDLGMIIDWVSRPDNPHSAAIDVDKISLLGHSLGGGIVILKAAEDQRVKTIITWAAVAECKVPWGKWPEETIREWEKNHVVYIVNSRTKQEMPLYFQLYEDFKKNEQRLDIQSAIWSLEIPVLLCHGDKDETVPISAAYKLQEWQPKARLLVSDSDHVFGRRHPWKEKFLPQATQDVVDENLKFLRSSIA